MDAIGCNNDMMNTRLVLFLLFCCVLQLNAQDYPRASGFHGKVKSVEQRSYKAKKHHGTLTSGRTAHEFRDEHDFFLNYDSAGRIISRTLYSNVSKQPFWSINFTYDSAGYVLQTRRYQHKKGLTHITNYENTFDGQGRLVLRTAHDQVPGPARHWGYAYDTNGFVTEYDASDTTNILNGIKLSYTDPRGHLLKEWYYSGTKLSAYMECTYDSLGNKTEERMYSRSAKLIYTLRWKYSAQNELERYENCRGNSRTCESWTYKYEYDQMGNWTKSIEYRNGKPVFIKERILTYY